MIDVAPGTIAIEPIAVIKQSAMSAPTGSAWTA
jgi:hypothetical protein